MHMRDIDTLIDSLENGHMVIDDKFIIKYWNSWLSINTRITHEEIVGKSLEEFYPELNYHVLQRKMRTALKLRTPTFYHSTSSTKFIPINRNKITTSSLSLMQQQVTITPYLKDEKLVMISLYDISGLHETELLLQEEIKKVNNLNTTLEDRIDKAVNASKQQIQQMVLQSRQAQMGEMISMIAHQWRQPLASISAISGTLTIDVMMDEYNSNFFQERLQSIGELAQHLSLTIDDFRGFFKEDNKDEISEVKKIVDASIKIIDHTLLSKNINLSVEYIDNLKIKGRLNEIKQVILNLLKNAEDILVDNNIKKAKIWIKVYAEDTNACISVEDNAGGIPEDIIDKVFDPYFSTKKDKEGTGLGLYMSKTIVEEHYNGKLLLKNTQNGASFTIKVPLNIGDSVE